VRKENYSTSFAGTFPRQGKVPGNEVENSFYFNLSERQGTHACITPFIDNAEKEKPTFTQLGKQVLL